MNIQRPQGPDNFSPKDISRANIAHNAKAQNANRAIPSPLKELGRDSFGALPERAQAGSLHAVKPKKTEEGKYSGKIFNRDSRRSPSALATLFDAASRGPDARHHIGGDFTQAA